MMVRVRNPGLTLQTCALCILHPWNYKAYRNILLGSPFVTELTACIVMLTILLTFKKSFEKMQRIFSDREAGKFNDDLA
ncbi:hypothetical protein Btru_062645 [Bulinus truncatus]|nr:hypothetical protein Btru_062645 [Bulinus truncatus]